MRALIPLVIAVSLYGAELQASEERNYFTANRGINALGQPLEKMSDDELDRFALGRSFFSKPWVAAPAATRARDGLGPLFNANSCDACHRNHGGGEAVTRPGSVDRSIVIRLSPDPVYGSQIGINAVQGVAPEAEVHARLQKHAYSYADGENPELSKPIFSLENRQYGPLAADSFINPRRAAALVGLGLVERIPVNQILELADPEDRDGDGISGSVRLVWLALENSWQPGRFGWTASRASLADQIAAALSDDMGLTSERYPEEGCSHVQLQCRKADSGGNPEVTVERVEAIAYYLRQLKTPYSGPGPDNRGFQLFEQLGCSGCHRHGYQIADNLKINPYSDFLLHDMGTGLADPGRNDQMGASEWRTAPLWGIGLAKVLNPRAGYLHDGRADSLEQAILWHAGEARASRVKFTALSLSQRAAVISFLESL